MSTKPNSRENKREIYTWVDNDVYEKLVKIASNMGMPISTLARGAILEMVNKIGRKKKILT